MKGALILAVLFAAPVFAQNNTTQVDLQGPCGHDQARFDVEKVSGPPITQAVSGKAMVFVSEVFKKATGEMGDPTLRIGINVEPGEHHLCLKWQSHFKRLSREAAFTVFAAGAGKQHYFRARVTYELGPDNGHGNNVTGMSITLDPISSDEGQYLVASNPMSVPHIKR